MTRGAPGLELPASPAQHANTRARLLEVEKRIAQGPSSMEWQANATYGPTFGTGWWFFSGRWYPLAAGVELGGLFLSAGWSPTNDFTGSIWKNDATELGTVTLTGGTTIGIATIDREKIGPDDYLRFHVDAVPEAAWGLSVGGFFRGPQPLSAGLMLDYETPT